MYRSIKHKEKTDKMAISCYGKDVHKEQEKGSWIDLRSLLFSILKCTSVE